MEEDTEETPLEEVFTIHLGVLLGESITDRKLYLEGFSLTVFSNSKEEDVSVQTSKCKKTTQATFSILV